MLKHAVCFSSTEASPLPALAPQWQGCASVSIYLPKQQAQICQVSGVFRLLFPAPPPTRLPPASIPESPLTMGQKGLTCPCPLDGGGRDQRPLEQRLRSTGQGSRQWGNKHWVSVAKWGVKKIKNQDTVLATGTSTRVIE